MEERKSKILSEIDRDREELEENDRNRYNQYKKTAHLCENQITRCAQRKGEGTYEQNHKCVKISF